MTAPTKLKVSKKSPSINALVSGPLAALLLAAGALQAAPKKPAPPAATSTVDLPADKQAASGVSALLKEFKPRAGLLFQPGFPLGTASDFLGTGVASFQTFGDIQLDDKLFFWSPIKPGDLALEVRTGLRIGYSHYGAADTADNSDINANRSGSISQWHTLADLTVAWQGLPRIALGPGLRVAPYGRLGLGTTFMSALVEDQNGNVLNDKRSVDGTFVIGAGAATEIDSVKNVVFLYELSYLHVFENQDGNFIHMALGAGYKF